MEACTTPRIVGLDNTALGLHLRARPPPLLPV